ncbi:MAG: UDP-N-acetylmuramoyl-L-alanyl-D-glutamate--2,6-diaminopimelate ligase [Sphingobacteriales bacterium]|nr:UDP-N-acetylmuramoyl-L-alanyl-D-glutamate--2,6-diaminopimelate ligase [Sphingobacteriales bacterium]
MKKLVDILQGVNFSTQREIADVNVKSICFDSRKVETDSMFVATRGTVSDGHEFMESAAIKGASVIVCEELPANTYPNVTYILVDNSSRAMGIIAANFYNHPSKKIKLVGITGTNGKTTIATLLFKLFMQLGNNVGLISTVENKINDEIIPSTHTTPDAISINELLIKMIEKGCDYCFMEVSSHATIQERIAGLSFTGGVFSNITHDHLDFHKTFDEYIKAKKYFFDQLPKSAFALTNADDKRGNVMLQNTDAYKKSYALQTMADFKGKIIENQFSGLLINIDNLEVWFKMIGSFNAYNILAVYGTAILLEQDKMKVLTILSALDGAEGRFEYIVSANGTIGVVDYAHTPDALKNVLQTIQNIRTGNEKIISIVGCGGDRDKTKRPIMAEVACKLSNKVILTSDNPRTEDATTIIKEMEVGVSITNRAKTLSIVDRKEAIKTACHLAQAGDIILLAGKGHEKYQDIAGVKYPFDDKKILKEQFDLLDNTQKK